MLWLPPALSEPLTETTIWESTAQPAASSPGGGGGGGGGAAAATVVVVVVVVVLVVLVVMAGLEAVGGEGWGSRQPGASSWTVMRYSLSMPGREEGVAQFRVTLVAVTRDTARKPGAPGTG